MPAGDATSSRTWSLARPRCSAGSVAVRSSGALKIVDGAASGVVMRTPPIRATGPARQRRRPPGTARSVASS